MEFTILQVLAIAVVATAGALAVGIYSYKQYRLAKKEQKEEV